MPRRKSPSPIFEEWERLVFGIKHNDGNRIRNLREPWRVMWDMHIAGDALALTDVDDAQLICSLGWEIAMRDGDFAAAANRITRWFEHPEIAKSDPHSHTCLLDYLAASWFYSGDEESACRLHSYLLSELPQSYVPSVRMSAATLLYIYCSEHIAGDIAPPTVAQSVKDVLLVFPGYKQTSDTILVDDAAYGELATYLAWLFVDAHNRRYRPRREFRSPENSPEN